MTTSKEHVASLDALSQVFHADDVRRRSLGFFSLGALGERPATRLVLPVPLGITTRHERLGRLLGIDAELHGHVDGLIELGGGQALDEVEGFAEPQSGWSTRPCPAKPFASCELGPFQTPSTMMPIERAGRRWS